MKRIHRLTSAFVLMGIFSCTEKGAQTGQPAATENTGKVELVNTMKLDYQQISHSVEFTANLQGFEEVHLAPASPGRIEAIYVETGSRVSAGTVLVQMDRVIRDT